MSVYVISKRAPDGALVTVAAVPSLAENVVREAIERVVMRDLIASVGRGSKLAEHAAACTRCAKNIAEAVRASVAITRMDYVVEAVRA